jgi:hypothetical protein
MNRAVDKLYNTIIKGSDTGKNTHFYTLIPTYPPATILYFIKNRKKTLKNCAKTIKFFKN